MTRRQQQFVALSTTGTLPVHGVAHISTYTPSKPVHYADSIRTRRFRSSRPVCRRQAKRPGFFSCARVVRAGSRNGGTAA